MACRGLQWPAVPCHGRIFVSVVSVVSRSLLVRVCQLRLPWLFFSIFFFCTLQDRGPPSWLETPPPSSCLMVPVRCTRRGCAHCCACVAHQATGGPSLTCAAVTNALPSCAVRLYFTATPCPPQSGALAPNCIAVATGESHAPLVPCSPRYCSAAMLRLLLSFSFGTGTNPPPPQIPFTW